MEDLTPEQEDQFLEEAMESLRNFRASRIELESEMLRMKAAHEQALAELAVESYNEELLLNGK